MGKTTSSDSIWLFNPSFALAVLGAILFFIPSSIQILQTSVYRTWYFLPVAVGGLLELAGYIAKVYAVKHQDQIVQPLLLMNNRDEESTANMFLREQPPYAVQQSLIVIAPLFFGAGDYILVSRLCAAVLPSSPSTSVKIYGFPTGRLTSIFILCDIFTFLVQVSGSGIASSNNWQGSTVKIGLNVLIAGLALQLATFLFFILIIQRFHALTKREGGARIDAVPGWRMLLRMVYITSGLIILRSIYRLIEFALGIFGYPFTHEWMFYVFEALPMLIAITNFCICHPGRLLGPGRHGKEGDIPLRSFPRDEA